MWPTLCWRYKDHKFITGKPVSSNIISKITNSQNKTKYESYVIEAEEYESEKTYLNGECLPNFLFLNKKSIWAIITLNQFISPNTYHFHMLNVQSKKKRKEVIQITLFLHFLFKNHLYHSLLKNNQDQKSIISLYKMLHTVDISKEVMGLHLDIHLSREPVFEIVYNIHTHWLKFKQMYKYSLLFVKIIVRNIANTLFNIYQTYVYFVNSRSYGQSINCETKAQRWANIWDTKHLKCTFILKYKLLTRFCLSYLVYLQNLGSFSVLITISTHKLSR